MMKILFKIIMAGGMTGAASGCAGDATCQREVIYNGIELPAQWPPRYESPAMAQAMPVPYLDNKPDIIAVNVGRQLFVDDFLIASTDMERVSHPAQYYESNPVLEPEELWEMTADGAPYAAPFSDGVWYDEMDGKFKMWYLAGAGTIHKEDNQTFYTCYAESVDGIHWVKPGLDIVEGTSIVDTNNRDAATVWLDKQEKDPARRFKFFNVERRPGDRRWQFILKYSADGIHWGEGVAQSGDMYDRSSVFYNPFRGVWALSMRSSTAVSSRSRAYLENNDPEVAVSYAHRVRKGVPDLNVVYWFTPSDGEPRHPSFPEVNPGIYNFDCIAYESIMLGQYSVWQGPENGEAARLGIQKRNEILLGYSRDGFHFYRPSYVPFMGVNETDGAWNWGNVQSAGGVPIIVGDELYFYVSGRRKNKIMWDSFTSTGLAKLRRDGFVSMRSGGAPCTLTTEKIVFDGAYLFVNAVVGGSLTVEVLNADGKPLKGYSGDDAITLEAFDATKARVSWKNNSSLSGLKGKAVRLRFTMTDGDLYSFWVSPWESGESRGYTAGGGPGLAPGGIDVSVK